MKKIRSIIIVLHRKRLLFIIPILAIASCLYLIESRKTLTVFPGKKYAHSIQTYSDASENGKTTISSPVVTASGITFDYTLRKSEAYPYAGLKISLMTDSAFLDISKYNNLVLDLEAGKAKSQAVYLKAFIDGTTRLDQLFTHEFLMKELMVDSTVNRYTANIEEFVHPSWWLEDNHYNEANLGKPHFSKMISMELQNGISTPFDVPIRIAVTRIAFVKDTAFPVILISGCALLYFFMYMLVFMVVQRKVKAKQTVIPYKELVVENDSDKDMQRIMNAVAKHFADPEFSVEKLAREAGVSASRIPGMLKVRFDMNFKQYLNVIRITEAKRLLRETDNQITTCAYNVGYNNIPHFNRTFKQLETISPKEYRKNLRLGEKHENGPTPKV
jgi:AraC-like DNA-binding protein